jgi:D-alanine-D-alanine ligase-like ATP-grasp enzyme
MDTRVVVEPFAQGREFTVIILQNRFGLPVAILPTEIETDYFKHQIFDFRKKYLPTRQVTYHCPPRFDNATIEKIQVQAEQLFQGLHMRDFARFDGWKLDNGEIWFSDINPISGMEQNSFLFQQSSRLGLSHAEFLRYVVRQAGRRYGLTLPDRPATATKNLKPVNVLFGGQTSERQVSLMSGTNVWLKLRKSKKYQARPFLWDTDNNVWSLPYTLTLNHTVEEIAANCRNYPTDAERLSYLTKKVDLRLDLARESQLEPLTAPQKMSLTDFIKSSPYVFIGLHGGAGENGTLQKKLEAQGVKYNGPDSRLSALCADKWRTKQAIQQLALPGLQVAPDRLITLADLLGWSPAAYQKLWREISHAWQTPSIIVKPQADGCSSGIARLHSAADLQKYVGFVTSRAACIPKNSFLNQRENIEMPTVQPDRLLLEKFIETDQVRVINNRLKYRRLSGWLETTIGILEENGRIRVLNPSLTIAEGAVLSVEEKFQSGTGVNITPPPTELIKPAALARAKSLIKKMSDGLGLKGYSRIDAFLQVSTGNLIIIEINTLPGLTPSTVLYHQGLAEKPPIFPRELLEKIIAASGY